MTERPNRSRNRERHRSPTVSVLAALALVVACGVFVLANHLAGGSPETDNGDTDPVEPINSSPPMTSLVTPSAQPPDTEEPAPGQKVPAVVVKGMYIDAWTLAAQIDRFIEICNNSEINAIVIDIKDENGLIPFLCGDASFSAATRNIIPDIEQFLARLKENGIYTIGRLVCFKDNLWSSRNPGLAIRGRDGADWADQGGVSWLNPYNTGAWDYIATLALESARLGFDEIQLDYVRFPADGRLSDIDFGLAGAEKTKAEAIGDFLQYMRGVMEDTGVWLSADVFGIIAVARGDFEGIGQDLEIMVRHVDYVCPMIYPSHFANERQNGVGQYINGVLYSRPDLEPYGVIYNILVMTMNRMPEDGNHAVIRPYLQAFTANYLGSGYFMPYTAHEVLEQIRAVYDAGLDEWILWNHSGRYELYDDVALLLSTENDVATVTSTNP